MLEQDVLDDALDHDPSKLNSSPLLEQWLVGTLAISWLVHYTPWLVYDFVGGPVLDVYLRQTQVFMTLSGWVVAVQYLRHPTPNKVRLAALGVIGGGLVYIWKNFYGLWLPINLGYDHLPVLLPITLLMLTAALKHQQKRPSKVWRWCALMAWVYLISQCVVEYVIPMGWIVGERLIGSLVLLLLMAWGWGGGTVWSDAQRPVVERFLMGAFTFAMGSIWGSRILVLSTKDRGDWQSDAFLQQQWLWLFTWLACLLLGLALVVYYKQQKTTPSNP